MKAFIFILIVMMGCTDPATNEYQSRQIDSLKDRMTLTEDALIVKSDSLDLLKEWVADLQQEQTFQFKDIDSTKRALGAVSILSLDAYGIAVRVDSTVKVGRDRSGKRTAVVMEVVSWIPFLAPFIKKK